MDVLGIDLILTLFFADSVSLSSLYFAFTIMWDYINLHYLLEGCCNGHIPLQDLVTDTSCPKQHLN